MHTIDDLRRALAERTEHQSTRLNFADVKRAAGKRRFRTLFAGIAVALTPILAAGGAIALSPAGPSPRPSHNASTATAAPQAFGSTIMPPSAVSSFPPPAGPYTQTGLRFGDAEEVVLWNVADYGPHVGLRHDTTGAIRDLGSLGTPDNTDNNTFSSTIAEVLDRHGSIIDVGLFHAAGVKVKVTAGGHTVEATTAPAPGYPNATVFWVRRGGVAAAETSDPNGSTPDAVFTAYSANGTALGTTSFVQRVDSAVNRDDRSTLLGDRIRTGVTLADGGELMFWFDGDDRSAMVHAGSDRGQGTIQELTILSSLQRPPSAPGFYLGIHEFPVPGGKVVQVGIYVGPAAKVEMAGDGGAPRGSGAWSAHPELRVLWGVGSGRPSAIAWNADGSIKEVTDFRN
ncbi:hypothetical protein [Dactylosporangium sp. CA-233914]|uniref:hypothetical protein n=1 Tax=Dactylosporangium sp. CA-233914 TaxID=3239934 RepID=UPI003D8C2C8F